MDNPDEVLYSIQNEERNADRKQKGNASLPSPFASGIIRSVSSITAQEFARGMEDESEFPYDTADPSNFLHDDNNDGTSIEDTDETSNDESSGNEAENDQKNPWNTWMTNKEKAKSGNPSFVVDNDVQMRKKTKSNVATKDMEMTPLKSILKRGSSGFNSQDTTSFMSSVSTPQGQDPLSVTDLVNLRELTLDSITECIQRRYMHDLVYTNCGSTLISVNPLKTLDICTYKYFEGYTEHNISDIPHLFAVSAKVYQEIRKVKHDQIILVSGESGSGKTEATKLIVRHLLHICGKNYDTLPDRIIQINPLLETFGNAKTQLNNNSSRFTKLLTLGVNSDGLITNARVEDYMLEKSRVVHNGERERTFHAFYCLLVGGSDHLLDSLFIKRKDTFKVTGDLTLMSRNENKLFRTLFDMQLEFFKLIKLTETEVKDIYTILAAILHLGNVEFQENENDSVIIKDENVVFKVATLLNVDIKQLTQALIERTGRLGKDQKTMYEITKPQARSSVDLAKEFKTVSRGNMFHSDNLGKSWDTNLENTDSLTTGDIINLSKTKKQAEYERDATAMALYERMFGWLVRKINDSMRSFRSEANIRILDICGFENFDVNSFEQLCINLFNEQLHNFINKTSFEDEGTFYIQEGVEIENFDIKGVSNDAVLHMFMETNSGILTLIDEDSKLETSTNEGLISKLVATFGNGGVLVPSVSNVDEFRIRHFAGEVVYDAHSFIPTNRDNLSEAMKECLKESKSLLIQDLFSIQVPDTGSVSKANYNFRGSNNPKLAVPKIFTDTNLSESINNSRKATLQQKFGDTFPTFQNGDLSQRNTRIKFFRNQLNVLRDAMKRAQPHFVRCIKPNDLQLSGEFSKEKVKCQLQYSGIKEIAKIQIFGFPVKMSKDDFKKRYIDLANQDSKSDFFHDILQVAKADISQYTVGTTQIFMMETVKARLEEQKKRQSSEMEWIKKIDSKTLLTGMDEDFTTIPLSPILEGSTYKAVPDGTPYNIITSSSGPHMEISEHPFQSSVPLIDDESETVKSVEAWDIMQELTEEEERKDVHEQPTLMVIKVIVYIFIFVVNLVAFVMQKVSFLLLTTGLKVEGMGEVKKNQPSHKDIETVFFLLLVIAICIPYALSWIIAVAKVCFGNFKPPSAATWFWVMVMESLHSIGLCLLVFRILPNLNVYRSVMLLSATAILPSLLKLTMSSSDPMTRSKRSLQCCCKNVSSKPVDKKEQCVQCFPPSFFSKLVRYLLDFVILLAQISVIPLVIYMSYFTEETDGYHLLSDNWHVLEIIGTFILVSCDHWENFTDGNLFVELEKENWFKNAVLKIRFELQNGRHFPHIITYLWKIGLTLLMGYLLNEDASFDYKEAITVLSRHKQPIGPQAISAAIAVIISGCLAFYMSFMACKFQMQVVSLSTPALLAVPVTFLVFYVNTHFEFLSFLEADTEKKLLGNHLQFPGYTHNLLLGLVWWLSMVILNRHMWFPRIDGVANMARYFISESYCGILTSESIMLNRIRNPSKVRESPEESDFGEIMYYTFEGKNEGKDSLKHGVAADDVTKKKDDEEKHADDFIEDAGIPHLFACATMWHETRIEMIQLLKSLHRLDKDQFEREMANINIKHKGNDPDMYKYEAHILFDDAMDPDDNDQSVPNKYVKELITCMDVACSSVHGKPMKVHDPVKLPTPYGGQLIWQMPGGNLLVVHMKDIKKIRNRKRWSQVMYMYYLLGFRQIMASRLETLEKIKEKDALGGNKGLNIHILNALWGDSATIKIQNTFLLALDGDTDFSPGSIKILMKQMKKDETVGAACGRIHPIGNGPVVWYQKFEYAIGHWLQKSSEHVFGCVLCSPGCFSLFRASALLDTNVMKRYTTIPKAPSHHLQFDQGEDRWLCTLLLQQGYKIEYAAGADAWTYAPEGFSEFFNQRRRWMPSTIANIIDLLGSADATTKKNANISKLYIGYQWLLMLMTVLGPGTITMMIAGAVKLVFKLSLVEAYIFALVPAAFFIVVCFWFSSQTQLIVAAILSVFYTFIMMVVLVGTIITATTENILHPSVIVITLLVGIFVIAGLCHPQEIWCLVHGVMYLLTIPSGYLLMVIYSICNLNNVSWGTREVPTKAERLEIARKKKEQEELEKTQPKKGFLASFFGRGEENIREMIKLLMKVIPKKTSSLEQGLTEAASGEEDPSKSHIVIALNKITKYMELIVNKGEVNQPLTSVVVEKDVIRAPAFCQQAPELAQEVVYRDDLIDPVWAKDEGLGKGAVVIGNKIEMEFWKNFIKKYLKPIDPTSDEKKQLVKELRDLRNSSAFGMIVVNLLWMAINFMFQLTNAARFTITYGNHGENKIEESVLGLAFVFLLLLLLIIQMIGMFIHRMETFQLLLAITEIPICKARGGSTTNIQTDRANFIKNIQQVFKFPMPDDLGVVTPPPVIAPTSQRRLGMTIAKQSSKDNISARMSFIGQSNKISRMTSFRDMRYRESVKQRRLENGDIGNSYKPILPPRSHQSLKLPMLINASNFRYTHQELKDNHIVINVEEDESIVVKEHSAMGRSLKQRFNLMEDEVTNNSKRTSLSRNIEVVHPKKQSISEETVTR